MTASEEKMTSDLFANKVNVVLYQSTVDAVDKEETLGTSCRIKSAITLQDLEFLTLEIHISLQNQNQTECPSRETKKGRGSENKCQKQLFLTMTFNGFPLHPREIGGRKSIPRIIPSSSGTSTW